MLMQYWHKIRSFMASMCAMWSLLNCCYGNCRPPTADAFESTMAIRCAEDTGTVCAYVKQVPNQPIVFYNDPSLESRVEDQIIAWSWVSFGATYDTPEYNPALPLRNPMTKVSAVPCS